MIKSPPPAEHFSSEMGPPLARAQLGVKEQLTGKLVEDRRGCGSGVRRGFRRAPACGLRSDCDEFSGD